MSRWTDFPREVWQCGEVVCGEGAEKRRGGGGWAVGVSVGKNHWVQTADKIWWGSTRQKKKGT